MKIEDTPIINSFLYKIFACSLMLVDHVGAFIFPNLIFLRILGRLAFPLFAYQFIIGLRKTSNAGRQLKLLLFFAIISQVPYYLLHLGHENGIKLNILFTLFLSSLFIRSWQSKKLRCFSLLLTPLFYFCDYSFYGLILILMIYLYDNWNAGFLVLNIVYFIFTGAFIQMFSLLAYPLIKLIDKISLLIRSDNVNLARFKKVFYLFYPVHLSAILIILLTIRFIRGII